MYWFGVCLFTKITGPRLLDYLHRSHLPHSSNYCTYINSEVKIFHKLFWGIANHVRVIRWGMMTKFVDKFQTPVENFALKISGWVGLDWLPVWFYLFIIIWLWRCHGLILITFKLVKGVKRRTTHFWVVKFHSIMSVEGNFSLQKEQNIVIKITTFTLFRVVFHSKTCCPSFKSLNEWKFTHLDSQNDWHFSVSGYLSDCQFYSGIWLSWNDESWKSAKDTGHYGLHLEVAACLLNEYKSQRPARVLKPIPQFSS